MSKNSSQNVTLVYKVQDQFQASADPGFVEVATLIQTSNESAFLAVNAALVDLYWRVGEYISRKLAAAEWGDGVVAQLAAYLADAHPGLRGFTRANLFRMRSSNETYRDQIVAPLVRLLPWTHNLIILGQSKRAEEREFYLRTAAREKWSKRELERQFTLSLFERAVLTPAKVSPVVRQSHPQALAFSKMPTCSRFLVCPRGIARRICTRACWVVSGTS